LAQQHQDRDDSGRFEVHGNRAMVIAELGWEERWREQRHNAVAPRHTRSQRDQCEHVEIAGPQRLIATLKERKSGPQHNRRGQRELNPWIPCWRHDLINAEQMPSHFQHEHRSSKQSANPEALRHVDQFWIWAAVSGWRHRLQRHAANWA